MFYKKITKIIVFLLVFISPILVTFIYMSLMDHHFNEEHGIDRAISSNNASNAQSETSNGINKTEVIIASVLFLFVSIMMLLPFIFFFYIYKYDAMAICYVILFTVATVMLAMLSAEWHNGSVVPRGERGMFFELTVYFPLSILFSYSLSFIIYDRFFGRWLEGEKAPINNRQKNKINWW